MLSVAETSVYQTNRLFDKLPMTDQAPRIPIRRFVSGGESKSYLGAAEKVKRAKFTSPPIKGVLKYFEIVAVK